MSKPRRATPSYAYPLIAALALGTPAAWAEKPPPLWGYGVKTCAAYLAAADGEEAGTELAVWEYRRFEDWLTGFVSGLNLATGKDVLVGANIDSAMQRVRAYCRGHEDEDFFTAAMDLVRMLSRL